MTTDPIADYLTRIRNAMSARHSVVSVPASRLKKSITAVLLDKGYIKHFTVDDRDGTQGTIRIALKYVSDNGEPVIKKLERVSRPGLRQYVNSQQIPEVINGLGIAILSTSRGVISDKEARKLSIGGEVLCYVQ